MLKTSAIVVGAGHCGLAMSRCLADRSIDHVVFERGEVAHVVQTDQDLWHTRSVVLAPGASTIPKVPALHGGDSQSDFARVNQGPVVSAAARADNRASNSCSGYERSPP